MFDPAVEVVLTRAEFDEVCRSRTATLAGMTGHVFMVTRDGISRWSVTLSGPGWTQTFSGEFGPESRFEREEVV